MSEQKMRKTMVGRLGGVALGLLALAACGNPDENPNLMNIRASSGSPDEFAILPTKPLSEPPDYSQLPQPTPGGANLTDPTPTADAVAALGGNPSRISTGIPGADGALVNATGRFGRSGNIRDQLAAEDLEYRQNNNGRLLERLMSVNVYYDAYEPQELDQHAELERFRNANRLTPSAPPELDTNGLPENQQEQVDRVLANIRRQLTDD